MEWRKESLQAISKKKKKRGRNFPNEAAERKRLCWRGLFCDGRGTLSLLTLPSPPQAPQSDSLGGTFFPHLPFLTSPTFRSPSPSPPSASSHLRSPCPLERCRFGMTLSRPLGAPSPQFPAASTISPHRQPLCARCRKARTHHPRRDLPPKDEGEDAHKEATTVAQPSRKKITFNAWKPHFRKNPTTFRKRDSPMATHQYLGRCSTFLSSNVRFRLSPA